MLTQKVLIRTSDPSLVGSGETIEKRLARSDHETARNLRQLFLCEPFTTTREFSGIANRVGQVTAISDDHSAQELRELARWYRNFAERAGSPAIWEARLHTAEDLDAEAERIEHARSLGR